MTIRPIVCSIVALVLLAGCVGAPDDDAEPTTSTTTHTPTTLGATREAREVTVRVRNLGCSGLGTGSGVAIGPSTLITNRHVVAGAERLEVSTWDGRNLTVAVRGVSPTADLAVVEVRSVLPTIAHTSQERLRAGEHIVVAGYPEGGRLTFRRGRVVDYVDGAPFDQANDVMRSTAEVLPGNSGGPVFDHDGDVVGVVFGVERRTGHALAIPADHLDRRAGLSSAQPGGGACPG